MLDHKQENNFAPFLTFPETGGIAISPLPQSEKKPGFIMKPFFGVEPVLMNPKVSVAKLVATHTRE